MLLIDGSCLVLIFACRIWINNLVSGFLYKFSCLFLTVDVWASNYRQEPAYLPQRIRNCICNDSNDKQVIKYTEVTVTCRQMLSEWLTSKVCTRAAPFDAIIHLCWEICALRNIKCWFSVRLQSKLGWRTKRDNSHFCGNLTHWFIQRDFADRVRVDGAFELVVTFFGSSLNHKMATISFSSQQSKPCDHAHCPLLSLKNLGFNPQLKSRKIASIVRRHLCGAS